MTTYFGDGNSTTNPVHPRGTLKHSYLYSLPGTYTVKHVLYDSGSPVDSVTTSIFTPNCTFANIYAFNDMNGNCVRDPLENPISGLNLLVEIDFAGVKIDIVNARGAWSMGRLTAGKTYTYW